MQNADNTLAAAFEKNHLGDLGEDRMALSLQNYVKIKFT
jgi:hypothetical protein